MGGWVVGGGVAGWGNRLAGPGESSTLDLVCPIRKMNLVRQITHKNYNCNVTQGQPWLSRGTLDVLVILFEIRKCTLDVFVILFGAIFII